MWTAPVLISRQDARVAIDPTARVLQLLTLLQTRRAWSGEELADRLEVTGRTLRRDIDRLRDLGYPVEAVRGRSGGYRLGAGAHLPPLVLDDDEAVAIAVGLRAAAGAAITGIEDTSVRALAKLEQLLPDRLRRRVQAVAGNLTDHRWEASDEPRVDVDTLTVLAQGCRDREEVRFGYERRDGEQTVRLVEPHHVVAVGRRWYLVAWDRRREDWRTFRLDRITEPALAGVRFAPRPVPGDDPVAYVLASLGSFPRPFEALVTIGADVDDVRATTPWLGDDVVAAGEGRCRVVLRAVEQRYLVGGIVRLAQDHPVEVLGPPALLDELRALGSRLTGV
jgi:predicted DNA-binding transcriptional regulator YafY